MDSKAIRLLKQECNRYVNGNCSTASCIRRGMQETGATFPLANYEVATCDHHKAVREIEQARELIDCLIENDPNDYAADAVTVLDVWRKDARDFMSASEADTSASQQ